MLFARNFGVSSPHDTCGWHSCAECPLKLGCVPKSVCVSVRARVYVSRRVNVHESSTRVRLFPVCVGRVSFCAPSAVSLFASLALLERARARTHTRARTPLLRHVSLSRRSRFHPLSAAWFFLVCAHEGRLPARREDEERRETRGWKREGDEERGRKRKGGRIREGR